MEQKNRVADITTDTARTDNATKKTTGITLTREEIEALAEVLTAKKW